MRNTSTVTILFTDVVGSTALTQRLGDAKAQEVLVSKHNTIVRDTLKLHSGSEIKHTGDGIMASFSSATRALTCAIAMQEAFALHNKTSEERIGVRIGLNAGEPITEEEDLFGTAVQLAARIRDQAESDEILVSNVMRELTAGKGFVFTDRRETVLKGFRDPVAMYRVAWKQEEISHSVTSPVLEVEEASSPSIAVLPFVDMSSQKDQEYFCDGLAEELINALTHIRDLHVVARTSAFSFKGQNVKIRDIGRELNVATILEGSVRKAGNRLRVTAQLVKVADGYHLWAERFDREMDDVFAIQDEITLAIVDKLKPRLLGEEKARLAKRRAVNLEAYNLFLRGRWFASQRTQEALEKAIECFNQAIEKEPDYAPAFAGLADCRTLLPFLGPFEPKKIIPRAREAVLIALQLDDNLAEAHRSMAAIKSLYDWNQEGGEKEFKRAIELSPGDALSHQYYAAFLMRMGRRDAAISEAERALELDPLSPNISQYAGMVFCYTNEPNRAISVLRRTLEMDPNYGLAHRFLGMAYLLKAKYEEAMAEFQMGMEGSIGLEPATQTWVGVVCARTGRRDESLKILEDLLERSKKEYVPAFHLASLSFALGETDRGFEWLDKAYEEHDLYLSFLKVSPLVDILDVRSDPRYIAMLKKIGLDK
jgi:TolB-like protein/Tfp pilus assembly protein PilF